MASKRDQLTFDAFLKHEKPRDGSMNFGGEFRNALSEAIRECGQSRSMIAARMTDLIWGDAGDGEITKAQLDSWTGASRTEWRFPLEYLPAFIEATGAIWLLKLLAAKNACLVVPTEQAKVMELAALKVRQEQLAQAARKLKGEVSADDVVAFLDEMKGMPR